jgi:hypothetical protein
MPAQESCFRAALGTRQGGGQGPWNRVTLLASEYKGCFIGNLLPGAGGSSVPPPFSQVQGQVPAVPRSSQVTSVFWSAEGRGLERQWTVRDPHSRPSPPLPPPLSSTPSPVPRHLGKERGTLACPAGGFPRMGAQTSLSPEGSKEHGVLGSHQWCRRGW